MNNQVRTPDEVEYHVGQAAHIADNTLTCLSASLFMANDRWWRNPTGEWIDAPNKAEKIC